MSRPSGYLLWAHGAGAEALNALSVLCARMDEEGDAPHILVSPRHGAALPSDMLELPIEALRHPAALLDAWRPDLILWHKAQDIAAPILVEAQQRGLPCVLMDVGGPNFPKTGWWPGRLRQRLTAFEAIYCVDAASVAHMRRLGAPTQRLHLTGLMRDVPPLPPTPGHSADAFPGGRPAWFAAQVPAAELAQVIGAHRVVLQHAHRFLLVLQLAAPASAERAHQLLRKAHMRGQNLAETGGAEEADQVLLCTPEDGINEYISAAPITYLGGSLSEGARLDPFIPAQLGSVVVHGPLSGPFEVSLARLAEAGGSAPVRHGNDLAQRLSVLLNPDHAAPVAFAAWQVVTEGATVTNRLVDLIRTLRDGEP